MRVTFYTLGCKVNQNETGAMEQLFEANGYTVVPNDEPADVYVVNSCTVTNFGDQKSRKWLRRAKRENPGAVTVLTGCYPQAFPEEAAAIAAAIDRTRAERPLTHSTMAQIIRSMGGSVSRAVIDRVKGTTFYATVYLRCPNGMYTRVDARPSDAIALVIRADAPLFVSREVLEAAALPRSFKPGADRKIEMEEFHKFIEDVKPEDFVTEGN